MEVVMILDNDNDHNNDIDNSYYQMIEGILELNHSTYFLCNGGPL